MDTNEVLNRIITKLDKLDDRIDKVDVTLAKQHESLKEHMRRSDALESQMKPVQKHVVMVEGIVKFIGLIGIIIGIASGIAALIEKV